MSRTNQQWLLTSRPRGMAGEGNFTWREEAVAPLAEGEVLVRVAYLSLDPTNRGWMNEADSYLPALKLGSVMRGIGIGVVEESRDAKFAVGDVVQGLLGWQIYSVSRGEGLTKLPATGLPLVAHLGLLGHIGMTAYFGLLEVGRPRAGETLVVSAAAGAVGSLVCQIGKLKGMRVVGIAGGEAKCRWLRDALGVDGAVDYRAGGVLEALKRGCPKGIDVYFENVGGAILEAVLWWINLGARIPVCGMISQYNNERPEPGPCNLFQLIVKRARMEGFLVSDFAGRFAEAAQELISWHQAGRLKYRLDVVEGLREAPAALGRLFTGANQGKLVVRVSPEP
jgi:NADPH-dependent curcumin reductase CurA